MSSKTKTTGDQKKIVRQKSSIKELKKLLTYYQEITDTIREPFLILDKDLIVVTANQAFYTTFLSSKLVTEGRLIYDLGDKQWKSAKLRELLEEILPKHKFFNNFEVSYNFPNIGVKTMLLNARQIDSKQLILLAINDITEQKQLTKDTQRMTANLIEQQKQLEALSDAKDEFIALASHQLRTPATIVKQYIGILSQGYAGKLTKKQLDMLDKANVSNDRQLEIIEDLLRVAKLDAGKVYLHMAMCNVATLLDDCIEGQLLTYGAHKQLLIFKKHDLIVNVDMDSKLMRMVLDNLLDNASKYSENKKTIAVTLAQGKTLTTISVSDAGVGILKKDQEKLFKRFSRIDNPLSLSTVGTGLGLYWVKKIIDLHGGTIQVSSKVNEGTKFTVKIPNVSMGVKQREVTLLL